MNDKGVHPMSTHLTAGQRALMEAALLSRQYELDKQIEQHLGGGSRSEHAREVLLQDGDDATARDADREVDLARSDQDIDELRAVNAALARLRTADYGLCIDCDAEIPFVRLQHNPQALRCVHCQAKFELPGGPTPRATI
jgi:DnaK suppressor protein